MDVTSKTGSVRHFRNVEKKTCVYDWCCALFTYSGHKKTNLHSYSSWSLWLCRLCVCVCGSPLNHRCCTSDCKLRQKSSRYVCRESSECFEPAYCSYPLRRCSCWPMHVRVAHPFEGNSEKAENCTAAHGHPWRFYRANAYRLVSEWVNK